MKVIIIGGVAGGASAAARLRRLDENAEIVLIERGEYISFANCGLPYYIGGKIADEDELLLQTPESFYGRFRVDVRVLSTVVSINASSKEVLVRNQKSGTTYSESYDKLVLATGAAPIIPSFIDISSERIFVLRSIPDTRKIRNYVRQNEACKTAAIIGGGAIGIELAENLHETGLSVTIVDAADHVFAPLDSDMGNLLRKKLEAEGITVILRQQLTNVSENDDGLALHLTDHTIYADMLILSIGIRPESELAKNAGLALTSRECIQVNPDMKTSDPDIYAVGDAVCTENFVTKHPVYAPLAGPANKQGRIVADQLCGIDSAYAGTQGSAIMKCFDSTVAVTGLNLQQALSAGIDADYFILYAPSNAPYYPGAKMITAKIIFEKRSGKILGGQFIGKKGVLARCNVLATAIRFGACASDLTKLELCYAPPYSSAKDLINMVGYGIENLLTQKVDQTHWDVVAAYMPQQKITLLDVREDEEYNAGHYKDAMHIPLDALRERLNELDQAKPVFVYCWSGMRSYLACRILLQRGYNAVTVSGGWYYYQATP